MKKFFNKAVLNGTTVMGDGLTYPRIPNVYTGDNEGGYQRGDMMDANAVVEMIKELTDTGEITIEELQNLINEEIQERVEGDKDQQRYTDQKIKDLIGTSPETLDTLKEIADALGEDPDFAANVWNKITELTTKHNEDVQELQDAITSGFENIDFTPYVKKTDVVTDTTNGLMLASDKVKLDNIPKYVLAKNDNNLLKIFQYDYDVLIRTHLIYSPTGSSMDTDYSISSADESRAGVMTASDKRKLNSLVKYKAGNGINITGDTISCTLDTSLYSIVTELPETGLPNKIYLLPSTKTEEGNIYTEYGYVDNKWEELGKYKADVDLSPYERALNLPRDVISHISASAGANYVNVYSHKEDLDRGILSEVSEFDIPKATSENAGIITAQDKAKLDGIEAGAQVNKIESVSVNGTPLEITNKGVNIPIHEYTAGDGINIANKVISTIPISIKTEKFSFVNSGSHQPTYNYSGVTIYDDRYISGTKYGIAFDEADIEPRTTITSPDGIKTVCFILNRNVRRKIDNAITSISVNDVEQVNTNGAVNLTIPNATTEKDGMMSKADKTKLDSLENYTLPAATNTTLGGVKVSLAAGINYNQIHVSEEEGIIQTSLNLIYNSTDKRLILRDFLTSKVINSIDCTELIKEGPIASTTENGLMSKEDKAKLDSQPIIKTSDATGVTDNDYVVIKKSELNSILSRLSALENKA